MPAHQATKGIGRRCGAIDHPAAAIAGLLYCGRAAAIDEVAAGLQRDITAGLAAGEAGAAVERDAAARHHVQRRIVEGSGTADSDVARAGIAQRDAGPRRSLEITQRGRAQVQAAGGAAQADSPTCRIGLNGQRAGAAEYGGISQRVAGQGERPGADDYHIRQCQARAMTTRQTHSSIVGVDAGVGRSTNQC